MNVAVIGSGFTGTMVAAHLARQTTVRADIVVFERTGRFGAGVAYATPYGCHLLNVPAARMSAFPNDPDHFLRWAQARDQEARASSFLPRQDYSAYLGDLLDAARSGTAPGTRLRRVDAEVTSITRENSRQWRLIGAEGSSHICDVVVLAIGNFPPANPPCDTPEFYDTDAYRQDPWSADALTADAHHDVFLVGTGLTMIDVAIALDHQGHRGTITALSRRGLTPQWLQESTSVIHDLRPPSSARSWPATTRGLVRGFREALSTQAGTGGDWRTLVPSLRSITPSLWQSLSTQERARFLRHVRPYWDTHRHGAAPAIGRAIDELRERGRLRVLGGRVLRYDRRDDGVEVTLRPRGQTSTEVLRVDRVINCTGPDTNLARVTSPLVQDLHRRGMLRMDPLNIGVATDEHGGLLDADGRPQPGLYLAGPLRRGQSWENLAVPELREEAAGLAQHLVERSSVTMSPRS